jgi:hypothetical protein
MLTIPFLITAGIYLAIRTSLVGMIGDRESNDVTDNPFLQLNLILDFLSIKIHISAAC